MENKFHKILLCLIGVGELALAAIGLLLIYMSHAHAPSLFDTMESSFAALYVLFPPAKPLYVGMLIVTGAGLISGYGWAWWAEMNLLFVRIVLLSLALHWSHELARMIRLFNPLVVEFYLALTVGVFLYLIYLRRTQKNLLKKTQGGLPAMIIFSLLTVAVLVITVKKYYLFLGH